MQNNDTLLKDLILGNHKELNSKGLTDYQKVCILRHWTAGIITIADYDLLFDVRLIDWYTLSAYEIYKLFTEHKGGVWCAGAAVFLKKVLELFGFEAYYWNYGHAMAFTHALTLVKIEINAKNVLVIQDAFFDTTYESQKGKMLDFFLFLQLLKEGRHNEITLVNAKKPLLRNIYRYSKSGNINSVRLESIQFTLESFFADRPWIIPASHNFLKLHNLPTNFIYLHLFPLSIWGGPKEVLEKAWQITGWPPAVYS